jgi:hypothetical protein
VLQNITMATMMVFTARFTTAIGAMTISFTVPAVPASPSLGTKEIISNGTEQQASAPSIRPIWGPIPVTPTKRDTAKVSMSAPSGNLTPASRLPLRNPGKPNFGPPILMDDSDEDCGFAIYAPKDVWIATFTYSSEADAVQGRISMAETLKGAILLPPPKPDRD